MIPAVVVSNELRWTIESAPCSDYGYTDHDQLRVILNADNSDQVREQTLWHEIIHILQCSYDLPSVDLDPEAIAKHYGPALFAFMKRNFRQLKWVEHEAG